MTEMRTSCRGAESRQLSRILGAYLNQDWPDDYGENVWDVVRDFCSSEPSDTITSVADQVLSILDSDYGEMELKSIFEQLRLEYYPPGDGCSYRGWLVELERFIRSEVEQGLE